MRARSSASRTVSDATDATDPAVQLAALLAVGCHSGPVLAGHRVRLHGLRTRPDLNCAEATVLSWIQSKERWAVSMLRGERICVKAANMLLSPCAFTRLDDDCLLRVLAWVPRSDEAAVRAGCRRFRGVSRAALQEERRLCGSSILTLLAIGGTVTDWPDCQKYPQRTLMSLSCHALVRGQWRVTSRLPFARDSAQSALLDGRCYLIGGYDDEDDSRSDDEAFGPPIRCLEVGSSRWSHFRVPPDLIDPESHFRPAVAACCHKLYLFFRHDCLVFEPAMAVWTRLERSPSGTGPDLHHSDEAACELDGAIFLAGGGDDNKQLWRFQPGNGAWERKKDMPGKGRSDAVAVSVGSLLYVIGGLRYGRNEDAMLIYDPSDDEWRRAPPIPVPHCGYPNPRQLGYGHLAATAHEGSVVVMGSGPPVTYDPATGAWHESEQLPSITLSMGEYRVGEGHDEMHPVACACAEDMDEDELEEEDDEYLDELARLPIESPAVFSVEVDATAWHPSDVPVVPSSGVRQGAPGETHLARARDRASSPTRRDAEGWSQSVPVW